MRLCRGGVPGCTRKRYSHDGLCQACGKSLRQRGTTAYATEEERSEVGRKAGLASVAAQKERLGAEGYLEMMQDRAKQNLGPRPTFWQQLERDRARQQEREERRGQARFQVVLVSWRLSSVQGEST